MNSEVAWLPVSSGTQVQTQKILNPDYLPEYLSVFYDYGWNIGQIVDRRQLKAVASRSSIKKNRLED